MKDVVQSYNGQVEFVSENWGESKLAARYGIKRYPVVFVNDILLAQPDDFGWYGAKGKYTPWKEKSSHQKFQADLRKMIDLAIEGKANLIRSEKVKNDAFEVSALPALSVKDIQGNKIETSNLKGKVVIVEFWATWCPPCLSTLDWFGGLKRKYGDKVEIVAIAVESQEKDVRELAANLKPPFNIVIGGETEVAPFGTLNSVPRMYVFDKEGKTIGNFFGAPADLHKTVGALINKAVK